MNLIGMYKKTLVSLLLGAAAAVTAPALPAAEGDRAKPARDRQSEHTVSAGWMQTRVYNEYIGPLTYEGPQ
ncbi:MAG: hypothetical protein K2H65_04640, partial [Bacteroidales bacterium]|nr:hypothetical protein [Bacteroidales bacterium]